MTRFVFTTVIVSTVFLTACADKKKVTTQESFEEKINELVLSENQVNQKYFFKIVHSNQVLEYQITYLGAVKTNKGRELKILNNVVYTGLYEETKRASATVIIYDAENRKLGFYYLGGAMDVPTKLDQGKLVFDYGNERCDLSTSVSLKDSIPHQIFIACTKDGGDVYLFSQE